MRLLQNPLPDLPLPLQLRDRPPFQQTTDNRQPTTDNRQPTTVQIRPARGSSLRQHPDPKSNRQQTTDNRQQTTDNRQPSNLPSNPLKLLYKGGDFLKDALFRRQVLGVKNAHFGQKVVQGRAAFAGVFAF